MKTSPNHTKHVPWAAILLVLAVAFPPILTLRPASKPAMIIPITGQPETHTLFQRTQGVLSSFFHGSAEGAPEAVESANRAIQVAGWYRAAEGDSTGPETAIIPNPDHSLFAFETRWIETAPYQYRREGQEDILAFHTNPHGEIAAAVLNGAQVYTRLCWTQTSTLKMGLLGGGLLVSAALALYRLRHNPTKGVQTAN